MRGLRAGEPVPVETFLTSEAMNYTESNWRKLIHL